MEERLRRQGEELIKKGRKIIEVEEGLLSCQICMVKYDRGERMPLCLKCGHTVCEECAKSLIRYGRVKCPFDNKSFDYVSID
jgi:nitrite reductase/ring-hydroxylating ferredoxin subunit